MLIRNTKKIDLPTIDLAIEADSKMIAKLPTLNIADDAKQAWEHELKANTERLKEIRPGYLDGRTEARHPRDTVIMLMSVSLSVRFLEVMEATKDGNATHAAEGTSDEVPPPPTQGTL